MDGSKIIEVDKKYYLAMEEVLRKLIENNFFASAPSTMATTLYGRKDDNKKNDFKSYIKDSANKKHKHISVVKKHCQLICDFWGISEHLLFHLWDYWQLANGMNKSLNFIQLLKSDFEEVSDDTIRQNLQEIANESFFDYCCVLALFYFKSHNINVYKYVDFNAFYEILKDLLNEIKSAFPYLVVPKFDFGGIKSISWCDLMLCVAHPLCQIVYGETNSLPSIFVKANIEDNSLWISNKDSKGCVSIYWFNRIESSKNPGYLMLSIDSLNNPDNKFIDKQFHYSGLHFTQEGFARCLSFNEDRTNEIEVFDCDFSKYPDQICFNFMGNLSKRKNSKPRIASVIYPLTDDNKWLGWFDMYRNEIISLAQKIDDGILNNKKTDYTICKTSFERGYFVIELDGYKDKPVRFPLSKHKELRNLDLLDETFFICRLNEDKPLYAISTSGCCVQFPDDWEESKDKV